MQQLNNFFYLKFDYLNILKLLSLLEQQKLPTIGVSEASTIAEEFHPIMTTLGCTRNSEPQQNLSICFTY